MAIFNQGNNMNTNYTVYENHNNPHATIHKNTCKQILKNGGTVHSGVRDGYNTFSTLDDAIKYAESTGLKYKACHFCLRNALTR